MRKNFYEVFDEFENAPNKKAKQEVLRKYDGKFMRELLAHAFDPRAEWLIDELPEGYRIKDVPPGMSYGSLGNEMRKFYLFNKHNPDAKKLTDRKRSDILIQILENLEPREAEVVMGIFRKDLGVPGLTYDFVKETFPGFLA